ncbi:HTH-type transcriptional regulator PuuR [Enhygromyxa salina]|uniref:HTH-type transcriptional regulator PuuR n=1 Tax=Enhygromyxa salina TaxID=215803 RepID=A0A2S9XY59_9BACT|nr:helix-turn-helix transcriptional regulator [Enhygromyxa salina]PRP97671.1 HTH-type transcriptional regulator PuuR [Enhygromyxa salina]
MQFGTLFGHHVRRLRKARGLTQERLAELSGLAVDTIRRLERDEFSPSLNTMRKLAGGLDLPMSTLFEALDVGEPVDPEIQELVTVLRGRPDLPVSALTAFVRELIAAFPDEKN